MRLKRHTAALALAVIAALILASCVMAPITIEDRIDRFEAALNGDRTTAYMNLVYGSPEYEANTGKADLWDIHFPLISGTDTTAFSIVLDAYTDPLDVQATITGPDAYSKRAKFVMENGGSVSEDWRIKDIQLEGAGPTWQSIFGP